MSYLQLVAKVRIFLETTKFFGNYFSKKVGFFTFSVFHFFTFDICVF